MPLTRQDLNRAREELKESLGYHAKAHDWAEFWGPWLISAYEELAFANQKPGGIPAGPPPPPHPKKVLKRKNR